MAAMPAEESESDILPFAIDGDNGLAGDAMQGNPDLQPGQMLLPSSPLLLTKSSELLVLYALQP